MIERVLRVNMSNLRFTFGLCLLVSNFGFLDFDVSVCFQIGNGKIICAYIGSWQ